MIRQPRHPAVRACLVATLTMAGLLLAGCTAPKVVDYTAFRKAKPASILVLPPVNESVDIKATPSMYAQTSRPLAEAGYYVMPVALVQETFQQNGLTQPEDMHAVPLARLREIFGADAVLYIKIHRFGTSYKIIASETVVEAEARLVDARSGDMLWKGSAKASSEEGRNQNNGLIGALVTAVIQQIVSTTTDHSHQIAGIASQRLLSHTQPGGILPGPRRPETKL
jgi:hypothetical protein